MKFKRQARSRAAANADGGYAPPQATLAQRLDQGHQDARAGGTDGVAQGTGTTVHVQPLRVQPQGILGSQRHHGEGFVDLEEVDITQLPVDALEQRADGADGGGGKVARRPGMGGVSTDGR